MTSAAGEMVSVKLTDCVSTGLLASVILNVSGELFTATVGVPAIAPVLALSDRPAGNVPLVSDQVYGVVPPVAMSVAT